MKPVREEPMTLKDFARKVGILQGLRLEDKSIKAIVLSENIKQQIRKNFCDAKNNLQRWLNREPCIFQAAREDAEEQEIQVRNDIEAIYYYLLYCRKVKTGETISDEFATYLGFILSVCDDYDC